MTKNKELLDDLKKSYPGIGELTYIELGILLQKLGLDIDWMSLGDAHEYLGGYKNEERDNNIKKILSSPRVDNAEMHRMDMEILYIADGKGSKKAL